MDKKLLVVIDMQKDFITGPLGNDECRAIVPNVIEKIKSAKENGVVTICTMDTHDENYLKTQEGKHLPVKHCITGTDGWQLIPEIPTPINKIEKPTFGSITLANTIKDLGVTEVELIGVCTDICVISNAFVIKAVNPEVTITVDASCCAGVTPESHINALQAMKACQINIINEQQ